MYGQNEDCFLAVGGERRTAGSKVNSFMSWVREWLRAAAPA